MAHTLGKALPHHTDYVAWLEGQLAHLRAGRTSASDVENVAAELERFAKPERRQLSNRLEVLILHRLKWDRQPDQRTHRWRAAVAEQRRRIARHLLDSPSLKQEIEPICRAVYPDAVQGAAIATQPSETAFPSTLPYTVEQTFERELPAEGLPDQRPTRKKHP